MAVDDTSGVLSLGAEASAELGDARRSARLSAVLDALATCPSASFPQLFEAKAGLEGAYRLLESDAFGWRAIESGHAARTLERCRSVDEVLVLHDTTDIAFKMHDPDWMRDGLVRLSSQRQGFSWHAALGVANSEVPMPLGLLASQPFVHSKHLKRTDDADTEAFWRDEGGVFDNEHRRWFDQIDTVRAQFSDQSTEPIHVCDREADSASILNALVAHGDRFVVRVSSLDRKLGAGADRLSDQLADVPFVAQATVHLGFRTPFRTARAKAKHPARKERRALLDFRATRITLHIGDQRHKGYRPEDVPWADSLTLHVVEAVERTPPNGQQPVRWLLWTTEPIETAEDIVHIVDIYRRRWLIEEYFKAIKTGCRLEKRQFRSVETILKCMATLAIVGWWLLAVRAMATERPDEHWQIVLTPLAFDMLKISAPGAKLGDDATVVDVLYAIASLGGHLKNNGPPGWQTMMKGFTTLNTRVDGARLYAALLESRAESAEM